MLAKTKIFENVDLTTDQLAGFTITLVSNPQFGSCVKDLRIHPNTHDSSVRIPPYIELHLDIILKCCPNLEIFGSPSKHIETEFCWSSLSATRDNQLKRLRRFDLSEWTAGNQTAYSSLCSKSVKSLSSLRLYFGDSSQDTVFTALKSRIREFVSLEQLVLVNTFANDFPVILELDTHIDNCTDKVRSLSLINCRFLSSHNYTGQLNTNNSITELELINPLFSSVAIQYFAAKLQKLRTLTLKTELVDFSLSETEEQYTHWWNQMAKLCRCLQRFNINIKSFSAENYLHHIKGGVAMLNASTDHFALDNTEFTMNFGQPDANLEQYIIEMMRNGSSVRLFGSSQISQFNYSVNVKYIFQHIQQFSPKTIKILNLASFNFESILECSIWSTPHIIESYSVTNWPIFKDVVSLIDKKAGSVVHLDGMIFPNSDYVEIIEQRAISNDTSISELKLTNSLFYPDVLSKMLKIPRIDSLILDRCIFITNSLCHLEINLPDTRLGRLEVNLNRVFRSHSLEHANGHYTIYLDVGTSKKAYIYTVNNQQVYQESLNEFPSENSFSIAIRCQELKSLIVSSVEIFKSSC
ncbi:hypothetical protein [Parasitella parasitica]|uniref:Uncharacterized protein n=1 Tax=Parasitella parasitica TaxID=35722 RepID=A0A0B7MYJ9_9FUNG|nr:hypothetical protein [Parasitella parasitica]